MEKWQVLGVFPWAFSFWAPDPTFLPRPPPDLPGLGIVIPKNFFSKTFPTSERLDMLMERPRKTESPLHMLCKAQSGFQEHPHPKRGLGTPLTVNTSVVTLALLWGNIPLSAESDNWVSR